LLIRAKLVSEQDVQKALQRLSLCGGRLGENLVAIGALTSWAGWNAGKRPTVPVAAAQPA